MKPFYTDKMLIECSTKEFQLMRVAVANEVDRWSDKDDEGNLIFKDKYEEMLKLYLDMSTCLAAMPWDVE